MATATVCVFAYITSVFVAAILIHRLMGGRERIRAADQHLYQYLNDHPGFYLFTIMLIAASWPSLIVRKVVRHTRSRRATCPDTACPRCGRQRADHHQPHIGQRNERSWRHSAPGGPADDR